MNEQSQASGRAAKDPAYTRYILVERVVSDFTYKQDCSTLQLQAFRVVKKRFDGFRENVAKLLNEYQGDTQLPPLHYLHTETDEHVGYRLALRETERWINTAVANDWDTGDPKLDVGHEVIPYPGPSGGDEPRNLCCDAISELCFDLIVYITQAFPLGRSLSVAVTRMQDVRGWLLDLVNGTWGMNAQMGTQQVQTAQLSNADADAPMGETPLTD